MVTEFIEFDPKATIIKKAADDVLKELGVDDPVLDIAKKLEEIALNDEYFVAKTYQTLIFTLVSFTEP